MTTGAANGEDAWKPASPPEPNGYLHIGHAKSICLNFGLARDYNGRCHLRLDDTNPEKEEQEYVDSICDSVRWLGFDWGDHLHYASDYFDKLYGFAEFLVRQGKAYVDSLTAEEIRALRGTLTEAGQNSPYRDRSIEENLGMFARMKAGEFPDGAHVLRLKIDMTSPNINLRDPVIYRIRHAHHHRVSKQTIIKPYLDLLCMPCRKPVDVSLDFSLVRSGRATFTVGIISAAYLHHFSTIIPDHACALYYVSIA